MPTFGVTPTGFVLPSQQQLLDLIVADQLATINPNVDVSSDSVLGQLNGVVSRQLTIGYEALEVAYSSNDPDAVEGFLQTNLAKLTGTPRLAATRSQVVLRCTLTVGTTLIAGTTLAGIVGNPASQWTPVANYTAAVGGAQDVPFQSFNTGPNAAGIGTISVITTPVSGWSVVTNALAATLGTNVESNADLRIRRELELQGAGNSNVDAIRAALLKFTSPTTGAFIQSVTMLNNVTDLVDVNGLPPHSVEAVIWDGPSPTMANNDVAQILWNTGTAGIRYYGALSGVALDALGNPHTLYFTRVTQIPVYFAFAVTARPNYVGNAAFKTAVAAACSGTAIALTPAAGLVAPEETAFGAGASVDPYDVVMDTAGLGAQVTGLAIGLSPPGGTPVSITTSTIAVGPRQIAVFDATQITVNGV